MLAGETIVGERDCANAKLAASRNSETEVPVPETMMRRRRPTRSIMKKPMSTPAVAQAPMLTMACAIASSDAKPAMPMISIE